MARMLLDRGAEIEARGSVSADDSTPRCGAASLRPRGKRLLQKALAFGHWSHRSASPAADPASL